MEELENYFKVTDSSGKIYELTAWVKVEKDGEKTFPATKLQLYTYFLNGTSVKSKIPAQTFTLDDTEQLRQALNAEKAVGEAINYHFVWKD